MKAHELARMLLEGPDVEILLQEDPEGNGYRSARGVDFEAVMFEQDYEIQVYKVYNLDWTADECCLDEEEWDKLKSDPDARVGIIFP